MEPPTSVLPGIKKMPTTPHDELRKSAEYVRTIYDHPVRGSRRRKTIRALSHATPSGDAVRKSSDGSRTSEEGEGSVAATANATGQDRGREALDDLRSDTFWRNYVIRWLTSVVAFLNGGRGDGEEGDRGGKADQKRNRTAPRDLRWHSVGWRHLSRLHGSFSSPGLVGVVTTHPRSHNLHDRIHREVILPPSEPISTEGKEAGMISIHLLDVPLDSQDYGSSLPGEGLEEKEGTKQRPFRILELGAGTGLVSLAITSIALSSAASRDPHNSKPGCGRRDVEIVATDYYPSVLDNLEDNLQSTGSGSASQDVNAVALTPNHSSTVPKLALKSCPLNWSTFSSPASSSSSPSPSNDTPLDGPFDVTFGADIVYEEHHAVWIKDCLKKLLRRPLGAAGKAERDDNDLNAYFHLIITLRSTHTFESGTIETVFRSLPQTMDGALKANGDAEMDLVILEKETIICEAEEGGDEVVYAYYKIGRA
ncbi:hypothetical protein BKA70DRAFT_1452019 [Coprinopsis sp. MPI-PUGE-AT-0042]|nr:hypothetical protein BKA70DRAFT_1452019 [Coprinopsis sp. MPI-PUGE-AT-0042]